jgi:hypothetical protein
MKQNPEGNKIEFLHMGWKPDFRNWSPDPWPILSDVLCLGEPAERNIQRAKSACRVREKNKPLLASHALMEWRS